MDGGFAIEHKVAAKPRIARGPWTAPVANCALDHCTGESELVGAARHGEFSSSVGRSSIRPELATDYPAMTTAAGRSRCPTRRTSGGLSLRAKKASTWNNNDETTWNAASGTSGVRARSRPRPTPCTSTRATARSWGRSRATRTPPSGSSTLIKTRGDTYTAVFASDLNNPVPKKGFDLVYAGRYGDAIAGASGGFCRCDLDRATGPATPASCARARAKRRRRRRSPLI